MVYQFKVQGIYKVDAQKAGEELFRIYNEYGKLEPAQVVNESRKDTAPLHTCFEWNDDVAAEKYREVQAGKLIRAIVTVPENQSGTVRETAVRAFVPVENKNYEPIDVVIRNQEKLDKLKQTALMELKAFQRKYQCISELRPVFESAEKVYKELLS